VLLPYKETLSLPCLPLVLPRMNSSALVTSWTLWSRCLPRCTSGIVLARRPRYEHNNLPLTLPTTGIVVDPGTQLCPTHPAHLLSLSLSLAPTLPSTTTQHPSDKLNHTTTTHDKRHGYYDSSTDFTHTAGGASPATHAAPSTPVSPGYP
jgi:hypothetical protein